jgi:hypothetical protein
MTIFSTLVDGVDDVVAAHVNSLQTQVGASGQMALCEGRLTLASGTPVTTSDQTAKTTVYFTPFRGNRIAIYDASAGGWLPYTFTEKSVAVPATTVTPFDVFGYISGGALALQAVSWTNDTTRATALTTQDGEYVKNGAIGYRYLGTGRTTGSSGQTEDSLANRLLWNYYNRMDRALRRTESTGHTYNTATWRPWNNSASACQATFILGVLEEFIKFFLLGATTTAAGNSLPIVAASLNATASPTTIMYAYGSPIGSYRLLGSGVMLPAWGYNYVLPLEYSSASGTAPTFDSTQIEAVLRG